jgi:hypothetical protein
MPDKVVLFPKRDMGSLELTEEYIRLRAYELWERHGCIHGRALEDWLEAEAQILGRRSALVLEAIEGKAQAAVA